MARKVYHDLSNKKSFSKRDMSFNDEGIFGKDDFSEFQYKWSGITKRHSTQNLYILFSSDIAGVIIPKRVFKTELEKKSFEKMLAQYLPLQAELPTTSN